MTTDTTTAVQKVRAFLDFMEQHPALCSETDFLFAWTNKTLRVKFEVREEGERAALEALPPPASSYDLRSDVARDAGLLRDHSGEIAGVPYGLWVYRNLEAVAS